MTHAHIPHRIEHSRNRHSRAFLDGSTIVIRLARNLSAHEEQAHIDNLLRRMARQVRKEQERSAIQPFEPLLQGAATLNVSTIFDAHTLFTLQPGTRTKGKEHASGWLVDVSTQTKRASLHRLLWKLLSKTYADILSDRVRLVNQRTLNVAISDTKLQYAQSQWGSCSARGVIMLNTALLFTSEELLDYVIIHELAHCVRKDHSKAYWKVVESALPNYDALRKKLRTFKLSAL
ncbi:MAG: hypothetical protein JWM56_534 [Candidatus Peribacteria bacterium]|nr:hypothetical protein [Candidatus Peribacteria bacterium]